MGNLFTYLYYDYLLNAVISSAFLVHYEKIGMLKKAGYDEEKRKMLAMSPFIPILNIWLFLIAIDTWITLIIQHFKRAR